eukprot:4497207-Pleurochrysis_carterae.AAC.3
MVHAARASTCQAHTRERGDRAVGLHGLPTSIDALNHRHHHAAKRWKGTYEVQVPYKCGTAHDISRYCSHHDGHRNQSRDVAAEKIKRTEGRSPIDSLRTKCRSPTDELRQKTKLRYSRIKLKNIGNRANSADNLVKQK